MMNKILIVDDSRLVSNAVKILLEHAGYTVLIKNDGLNVRKIINDEKVDLVILDLMMPGISGVDVYKDIKTMNVKILILSAKTDAIRWEEDLADVKFFMKKPFDNQQLLDKIAEML